MQQVFIEKLIDNSYDVFSIEDTFMTGCFNCDDLASALTDADYLRRRLTKSNVVKWELNTNDETNWVWTKST